MNLDQLTKYNKEIHAIAAKYGAKSIKIFGSTARGDTRPGSDVDFLVEMQPESTLFDLGGIQIELQKLLGCQVDVVTPNGLRSKFREQVLKEALPV